MAMRPKFGIQQPPIDTHLETTTIRRHKCGRFDHMLIILEQFFCQTHGPTQVVSDRAVHDFNFQHHPSANLRDYIIEVTPVKMLARFHLQDRI